MIKTILTVLEAPGQAAGFVEAIATLADYQQAHVNFSVLTTTPLISAKLAPFGVLYTLGSDLKAMSQADEDALRSLIPTDLSCDILPLVEDVAFAPTEVRALAPPADLIVLGHRDAWQIEWLRRHVTETLLLSSGTPLILLPAGRSVRKVDHAVLGWKPGPSSMRALHALAAIASPGAKIDLIHVERDVAEWPHVVLEPVAALLDRHGFVVEAHTLKRTRPSADMLTAFALDAGADLLAVGGYGHSRAREIALGGVTRSLIDDCRLPVLLAH